MLRVIAYTKDRVRAGSIGAASSVNCTLVRNAVDGATFEVPLASPQLGVLLERGTRVRILDDDSGDALMSGVINKRSASGPDGQSMTCDVEGDWTIFNDILAWPVPANPITNQNVEYRTVTGPLETVLKTVIQENLTRLGLNTKYTVEPTQGRGPNVTVKWRFHSIAERILGLLNSNRVSLEAIMQDNGIIHLTYREAQTVRRTIGIESGILTKWEWEDTGPEETRHVIGANGEGTARRLRQVIGTPRETLWGMIKERFIDARDIEETEPDAALTDRGNEQLEETAEKTGLVLNLISTPAFQYGTDYHIGDKVTVSTGSELGTFTDYLTTVTVSWTHTGGKTFTPSINNIESPRSQFYRRMTRWVTATKTIQRR